MRILRLFSKNKKKVKKKTQETRIEEQSPKELLSLSLESNIEEIKNLFQNSSDLMVRRLRIVEKKACLIYISGLADEKEISEKIIDPLLEQENDFGSLEDLTDTVTASNVKLTKTLKDLVEGVAAGQQILLVESYQDALTFSMSKIEQRSIDEPDAERVVRGPRDGFTEPIATNISLIRKRIRSPKLMIQTASIGETTQTEVGVVYLHGEADPELVNEVYERLNRIEIDGVLDSGNIEEFIEDNSYSPFPQMLNTERPDVVSSYLLEGHVAVLVDGSPFVLVAPTTMYSLLQASEDYYVRFMVGTLLRWLRYGFFIIALLLPSLYVSILSFHQEMLPTVLVINIAVSREMVPFPALIEALIMEVIFEVLREAGIRLPVQVGSAVGIVGALIIGEAAVQAGIVSPPMVIAVALTGISSFALPRYNAAAAIRLIRFPIIFLAGTLGLLGIMLGVIVIVIHLSGLRSFGTPYLSPLAPTVKRDLKDVLMRAPIWKTNANSNTTNSKDGKKPAFSLKQSTSKGSDPV